MESEYSWINYIKKRIKNNKNFICILSGPTGSGKSWSALAIAEMLNKDFTVERVVFRGKELMRLVNSENLKKKTGVVIVFDEAGIDLSSRNWQSVTNRMLNFLIQTFRHRNFVLLFTAPYGDFLDLATRKLFHAEFQTVGINKAKKTVTLKPKLQQYNSAKGKWYTPFLKAVKPEIGMVKVKRWAVPKPSKELIEEYEKKKQKFTNSLNKEIEDTLENLDSGGKARKRLTDRQELILECWKQGFTNQSKIAEIISDKEKTRVENSTISVNERYMRGKGYIKEKYLGK